jgi:hypothetical protein
MVNHPRLTNKKRIKEKHQWTRIVDRLISIGDPKKLTKLTILPIQNQNKNKDNMKKIKIIKISRKLPNQA